jgi:hypothetical protein
VNVVLSTKKIPWDNCIAFSVDNCSVNLGRHNSIMTRVHEINRHVYTSWVAHVT